MGRSWGAPALRQASVHDQMGCGCIPYEHIIYGPCRPLSRSSVGRAVQDVALALVVILFLTFALIYGQQARCDRLEESQPDRASECR